VAPSSKRSTQTCEAEFLLRRPRIGGEGRYKKEENITEGGFESGKDSPLNSPADKKGGRPAGFEGDRAEGHKRPEKRKEKGGEKTPG